MTRGIGIALAVLASVAGVALVAFYAVVSAIGTALAGTGPGSLVAGGVGALLYVGYCVAAPIVLARRTRTCPTRTTAAWLAAAAVLYAAPWALLVLVTR